MKMQRFSAIVLAGFLLMGSCFGSLTKKRVLSDLDHIQSIFEVKYAPLKWKEEFANWNLDQAIFEAKSRVESIHNPTLKQCQVILRDFFNSTRDYHVGVRFYSTESASLPFLVKEADNRYFVCDVDRDQVSVEQFPFEVGDEILTFNHHPIHDVVDELRVQELGLNTYETDLALAEMMLTNRDGQRGDHVPNGSVVITGIKRGEDEEKSVTLNWDYVPEKIKDFSRLGHNVALQTNLLEGRNDVKRALKESQFFEKFMIFHNWDRSYVGAGTQMSVHTLGSRSSYLPPLGKRIWKSGESWIFDAYIFQTQSGKKIGYIRIPHYMGDYEEVDEFGQVMNYFNARTDALVIDQLNNPGGSVFYLYALASTLTDKPIYAPKHHIAMTQQEVYTALTLLPYLEGVKDDRSARDILGDEMGGYPVDYQFASLIQKFCYFLIDQWNAGKLYTDPTHLFGVDQINPHPRYHYSKPVLLLINSLNFSGGDFFPAIMKDSKRATLLGTRTAGAGGYVLGTHFPNHSGMQGFLMTGSLAERIDKKPIENLGVNPDILYKLTPEDLQGNYQPYADTIVETVESLIK